MIEKRKQKPEGGCRCGNRGIWKQVLVSGLMKVLWKLLEHLTDLI
jgi:hypothetical protein